MPLDAVYIVFLEDLMSYEYLVDAIFKKKKDAEEYIEKRCAITGRNKDCYRIEKYPVD